MHDVSLKPSGGGGAKTGGQLTLEGTVKTYRYVEEDELDKTTGKPAHKRTAREAAAGGGQ